MEKLYVMSRIETDTTHECSVDVYLPNGTINPLVHCVHHSPTGFDWGYNGSGPADLALSILHDHLGEPATKKIYKGKVGATAMYLHQAFKQDIIAAIPPNGGTIAQSDIDAWLKTQTVDSNEIRN